MCVLDSRPENRRGHECYSTTFPSPGGRSQVPQQNSRRPSRSRILMKLSGVLASSSFSSCGHSCVTTLMKDNMFSGSSSTATQRERGGERRAVALHTRSPRM